MARINRKLAERYANHPALGGWHVSNEYNAGPCYCPLCTRGFQEYLKRKYGTLENLNRSLWSPFWSHIITDWEQIDGYDYYTLDGLMVDWDRYFSELQVDFMKHEVEAVRTYSQAPVTTNMMGFHSSLNYWRIADVCDFVADDCYPVWNDPDDMHRCAENLTILHDMHRTMKQKPFLIMESSPSAVNWTALYRLKRPGVHKMEMMLGLAHGADGLMYFQWRKGRGGIEKYHGAVVSHDFGADTRVFREVQEVGQLLEKLQPLTGSCNRADVAVIYDWETNWAIERCQGLTANRNYTGTVVQHYAALKRNHVEVDIIEPACDFSRYKVIVLPMLFMLRPNLSERLKKFVQDGGTIIGTYWTGYVNENNLCYMGPCPGDGLSELFGVRVEEYDGFSGKDHQAVCFAENSRTYDVQHVAERFRVSGTAEVMAVYTSDFYAGEPAVTCNTCGKGQAWYLGARTDIGMLREFYHPILEKAGVERLLPASVSEVIHASMRVSEQQAWLFVFNFGKNQEPVQLPEGDWSNVETGCPVQDKDLLLEPCGVKIFTRPARA